MMLCSPLTALQLRSVEPPPEVAALPEADRPPVPPVRPLDAAAVVVFFLLGTLAVGGGLLGLARIEPGRRMMLAFAGLMLLYMTLMIGFRLTGGLEDLFASVPVDAPRRSALGSFFVWTLIPLLLTAALLVAALRYLTRADVKRTFRGVRFG